MLELVGTRTNRQCMPPPRQGLEGRRGAVAERPRPRERSGAGGAGRNPRNSPVLRAGAALVVWGLGVVAPLPEWPQ